MGIGGYKRRAWTLTLALAAGTIVLSSGAVASAATVTLKTDDFFSALQLRDRDGQDNDVVVRLVNRGRTVLVRDDARRLEPRGRCAAAAGRGSRARCELPGGSFQLLILDLQTGDGDDRLRMFGHGGSDTLVFSFLYAGRGDDRVRGGRLDDLIFGGVGDDRIAGGGGFDEVIANPGPDGNDRIEGGPGWDIMNYYARQDAVTADLPGGVAGHAGETDTLFRIRGVIGGDGADLLQGGGGSNLLVGGRGPDTLVGRDGLDLLDGEQGIDQMFGNRGRDLLFGDDQAAETLDCGPQRDAAVPGPGDVLISCEEEFRLERARALRGRAVPNPLERGLELFGYPLRDHLPGTIRPRIRAWRSLARPPRP